MSALAQANILEFIASKGKVALPDIYQQFSLVSKRTVDDSLIALQERRELIRGGDGQQVVYAPVRARKGEVDTQVLYPIIRAKADELLVKGELWRSTLVKALPDVPGKAIDSWLYQEGRAGRLVRVKNGVYRRGAPPPVTTKARIEAYFVENPRCRRSEVMAALSDLNLHSVSTTLSEVIAAGKIRAVGDSYTWLGEPLKKPGVIKRGGEPLKGPGVIKRGGEQKPTTLYIVQRALEDGPLPRDLLLELISGPKPERQLADLIEYGEIIFDERTGGYMLPDTNTPSEATREVSAEATEEKPEAVATPTRAGDAPAESAAQESPGPEIGPAPALCRIGEPLDGVRVIEITPREEPTMSETPAVYNGTPANAIQVGGQHYKAKAIQPWDYIAANGLGFFEGNVVKYVSRWREKGGIEDLLKARHYLDKLLEVETGAPSE